jgi:AcrR family transcriptional regulator
VAKRLGGSTDPGRALPLLWGVQRVPRRGPRQSLSVEEIVGVAIELADADGLEALSMRRVAERFGVNAMALYTYVPGKAELVDLMLDAVLGEAARPDGTEGGWRAGLELYAREAWALYLRHPWALRVPYSRGFMGPNQAAALDSALRAVSGIGLSKGEMVAVFGVVAGYVQGVARTSAEAAQTERATGVTDDEWWSVHGRLMAKYIDRDRYPTLASISAEEWVFEEAEGGFEFGLRRVLDGIETYVKSRSSQSEQR